MRATDILPLSDEFVQKAIADLRKQGCTCIPDIVLLDGATRSTNRHMLAKHKKDCPIEDGRSEIRATILEI